MSLGCPPPAKDHVHIYLAARYNGHRADRESGNPHQVNAAAESYPYHLESYHYVGKGQYDELIRRNDHKLFMDSGAFSMFTLGIDVDLELYGRYLTSAHDYIEVASNVDAIGAGKERESYENQKALESFRLPVKVCPVHHARDDDRWLVKYLDEGYDYLFLGGMVPETTPYLFEWLDHIWDKYLALPDGTARIKVHGFGLTTFELMERYPWYSVDSTSWVMIGMFGNILMMVNGKPRAITFSERSPNAKAADKSFWSLDAVTQDHMRKVLAAEHPDFTPEALSESYGMRDRWNIRFFKKYMEALGKPVYAREAVTFF
jgi:hypothetical protein